MKEKDGKEKAIKKKKKLNGEKRFYLATAIACAVMLIAIVLTSVIVSGKDGDITVENPPDSSSVVGGGENPDDEHVSALPEGMIAPIDAATVSTPYGFYYNKTLDSYYEHTALDFSAEAGAEVLAIDDGVVESIYKEDVLLGTQITVKHANGIKSTYRFVTEADGLAVGDMVKKGQVIATVAEANGNEYKDGAHLHFCMEQNGKTVDPTKFLTLEEK